MTEVWVASGTSKRTYHTDRDCYHLKKAGSIVCKKLSHIHMFYGECSVCSGDSE